jgi:hypothetical protein
MASSWSSQIPTILTLLRELQPKSVLDVGKGLGKYGLLLHEYHGIDFSIAPDPTRSLKEQSRLQLDAVESEPNFLWPHIAQFYGKVFIGRVEKLLPSLPRYEVVMMIDVIEHLDKPIGLDVVKHFLACGSTIIIASPADFFQQENFGSADERHLSHWTRRDFNFCHCQWQRTGSGHVYCLSNGKRRFRTFGRSPYRSLKRIAHAFLDEVAPLPSVRAVRRRSDVFIVKLQ